jgi:ureidoglycolate lyase
MVAKLEPISPDGFAPFGRLLNMPPTGGDRFEMIDDLQNLRMSARPRLTLSAINPMPLPLTAVEMERHVFSSQTFVPIDCASYVVMVAPHTDDRPDLARLRAFRVPGDVGIHYSANTWHHPLTVLERPGRFVVLTFVDGGPTDEQFVSLPEPIVIQG